MKKILFFVSIFFMIFPLLKAQTSQGKFLVGVSSTLSIAGTGSDLMTLGFTSSKYKSDADGFEESDPDKTLSLNLVPKAGYFVIDNLAIGLDFTLALSNYKDDGGDYESKRTLFGTGPFIRYYIPTPKVLPFFEVNSWFGTLNDKSEYDGGTNEDKRSIFSIGAGVGAAVPIGDKVTFDVLAGYNSMTIKEKEDNEDNGRQVLGTIGLKFGFIVLLGSE